MEEIFFYMYYMNGVTWQSAMRMKIYERKWYIERFVEQRHREQEQREADMRKAKTK
jgi:hypothetical protein